MKQCYTERGFGIVEFTDLYGANIQLQQSSLATEDAVWLGPESADLKIMASKTPEGGTGWIPFNIPEDVLLNTRAHLSRSMVEDLIKMLQTWLSTGNFVESCSVQGEENSNSSPSGQPIQQGSESYRKIAACLDRADNALREKDMESISLHLRAMRQLLPC